MLVILALTTFPHTCVLLTNGVTTQKAWDISCTEKQEIILPSLVQGLLFPENNIALLTTFSEPGPFTPIRTAQSFIFGMKSAIQHARVLLFSVFDSVPDPVALWIGPSKWLTRDGAIHSSPTARPIARDLCSVDDTFLLLEALVQKASRCWQESLG